MSQKKLRRYRLGPPQNLRYLQGPRKHRTPRTPRPRKQHGMTLHLESSRHALDVLTTHCASHQIL